MITPATRTAPWNVMGTDLSIEGVTSVAEALSASGLDYTMSLQEVQAVVSLDGGQEVLPADRFRATVRTNADGSRVVQGVVGRRYTLMQNAAAFAPADYLHSEFGAKFSGAADFRGGGRSLLIMDLQQPLILDPEGRADQVDLYAMFGNAHDGSGSAYIALTPLRLACTNAVNVALRDAVNVWRMAHTPQMASRHTAAVKAMHAALQYRDEFQAEAERMIQTAMVDREFDKIVAGLFPLKNDASDRTAATMAAARQGVRQAYEGEANAGITGTRWGGLQAVIEYLDWARPVKGDEMVSRAEGALDGPYVRVKQRALAAFSA